MRKILKLELKNCLQGFGFKFSCCLLLLISISSFLINCFKFYGIRLSLVRSSYEVSIVQGVYSFFIMNILVYMTPLFASLVYADSLYSDRKQGIHKNIITRISAKKYIVSKAIIVFGVTWCTYFLTLCINQILCFITFPIKGNDLNTGLPTYDIGIQNFHAEFLFDLLRLQSPLAYNLMYIVLISTFASVAALLIYSLFFVLKAGQFGIMVGAFLFMIFIEIALSIVDLGTFSPSSTLLTKSKGSLWGLFIWLLMPFLIAIFLIFMKGLHKEIEIDD